MLEDYVVIDLEMTGLAVKTEAILEVGAIRVRGGRETDCYAALLNTGRKIPDRVAALTGITEAMAAAGREPEEAMAEFFDFLGEDVLVGQNVIFDYRFLKQWAVNHGFSFERSAVDTLKLARCFLPEEQKKDLESLCRYFGITRVDAHRAMEDARETWKILERLKADFGESAPEKFEPKPLIYKAKKQSPATKRQKEYLCAYAAEKGIALPENFDYLSRSEASRLADRWIAVYGKGERQHPRK